MLFFHVGWANPVPINPMYYKDRKKQTLLVAILPSVVNLILGLIFAGGIVLLVPLAMIGIALALLAACVV